MSDIRFRVLRRVLFLVLPLSPALSWGCGDSGSSEGESGAAIASAELPVVNDARRDLVLTWFGDGGCEIASSVSEVPSEARREVRVQDPTIPPEERNPDLVFVADLTRARPDGSYPVKAMPRAQFEQKRSKLSAAGPSAQAAPEGIATTGAAQIVMYATKHCPVCQNARRWLLDRGIPYTEKDVEENEANAAELAAKGRAQGVPTSGVPVFEIRGHLLPGFDPGSIQALLNGAELAPAPSPPAAAPIAPPGSPMQPAQPLPATPAPPMQPMQPIPPAATQQQI